MTIALGPISNVSLQPVRGLAAPPRSGPPGRPDYSRLDAEWLRWRDAALVVIPTGAERAEIERQKAEAERERADRLSARLKALGMSLDE
ncbi:MAG: hypothetical protein IT186_07710 [Acidobacteria bacterium]|nr:hypothetical protein [Acidobacteriota bacterium]MCG3194005.1 hypothetical protein [Thermoanaerobaculia bacterium]